MSMKPQLCDTASIVSKGITCSIKTRMLMVDELSPSAGKTGKKRMSVV